MTVCEWCGHQHDVQALCSQRPKWSRRGFIALMGSAVLGLASSPAWLRIVDKVIVEPERALVWVPFHKYVLLRQLGPRIMGRNHAEQDHHRMWR